MVTLSSELPPHAVSATIAIPISAAPTASVCTLALPISNVVPLVAVLAAMQSHTQRRQWQVNQMLDRCRTKPARTWCPCASGVKFGNSRLGASWMFCPISSHRTVWRFPIKSSQLNLYAAWMQTPAAGGNSGTKELARCQDVWRGHIRYARGFLATGCHHREFCLAGRVCCSEVNANLAAKRLQNYAHYVFADDVGLTARFGHCIHHYVAKTFGRLQAFCAQPCSHILENRYVHAADRQSLKRISTLMPIS